MALIALLWFGVSAPLSAVGSYFGSKHGVRSSQYDQQRELTRANYRLSKTPSESILSRGKSLLFHGISVLGCVLHMLSAVYVCSPN